VPVKRLLLLLCLLPTAAKAQDLKDRFNAKVIFQGMYMTESQASPDRAHYQASPFSLLYGDLRLVLDGRRLPGKFDIHIDARGRLTNEVDTNQLTADAQSPTARGYYGGREYELREIWARRRGEKFDFAVGRQFVLEADALKIDGIRAWYRFVKHWDFSLFAGGYPKPYSRSVTTDYQGSNGYYGAAVAGGGDVAYIYDKFWGSIALVGAYLGGNDDGGPIKLDATNNLLPPNTHTETPRGYLHWTGFERFASWLDIFHDLVFDFAGAAGLQLTRLDIFATARAGSHFTIRAGYDHLTSFAIEMYLNELLTRRDQMTNVPLISITNNLIVERTARDQGTLRLDATWGKFDLFGEGRFRLRYLANKGDDPQFIYPNNQQTAPSLAYDFTFGARDLGTLKGLRAGLWYTYLADYRASSHILGVDLGRGFLDERLTLDFHFLYAKTTDYGTVYYNKNNTAANPVDATCGTATASSTSLINLSCYGLRDGAEYELGFTATGLASKHWFLMLDYRFVANQTAAYPTTALMNNNSSTIFTHLLLFRVEARY
jgi:hypothetical protein